MLLKGLALLSLVLATAGLSAFGALPVSDTPGLTWSNEKTSVTPENGVTFHGDFSNGLVTAALENLPAHDYVQISVQLLILRSWDGYCRGSGDSRVGPDFFRMGLEDGRTLVQACFSNTPVMSGFRPEGNWQSYPSPVPGDRVPFMTGADFKNNFGYTYPTGGSQPPITIRQDAVYTLKMTVPHKASKVELNFRGMGLQGTGDESWGVMNVRITPRTAQQVGMPMIQPGEKDEYDVFVDGDGNEYRLLRRQSYETLLKTAAGRDALAANDAFWKLVTAADGTAAYLAKTLKPVTVDRVKIGALAARVYQDELPRDEKDERIQALVKLGVTAEPVLRDLRQDDSESPTRLDWALMETAVMPVEAVEMRQWIVGMRILEAIGTDEAKKARTKLMGAPAVEKRP
jgi:hypothetical protein